MTSYKEVLFSAFVCSLVPLCAIVIATLFIIPFSVTLSIAVDNQDHQVICDIKKAAYVSSISESEDMVIVSLVNPITKYDLNCPTTQKLRYPKNRTLYINEMVTIYEECWSRCYSHKTESYMDAFFERCPKDYYWEPPKSENDCNVVIGWMSFIVAVAALVFIAGFLLEITISIISLLICGYLLKTTQSSFETW